ncbi:MAG: hybrid sensor histidine kinase/response regulator [Planctomycetes bacterium]|nr:hybrid sensor histidine kinase/response regulator [Planctomycetota bacterium]
MADKPMKQPNQPEDEAIVGEGEEAGSVPDWRILASRLKAVSELTADCCWMRLEYPDGRSYREWITGSFARLTGYGTEEFSDIGLQRLVHPDDLSFALGRVKGPEGISEHEFRIVTKSGEVRWLEERMRVERREDGVLMVFGSTRDITVQKTAEDALRESRVQQHQSQKMEALGMLAGGVAHDFNNLLTVIMGNGELVLESEGLEPDLMDCGKEMCVAAERAAELTRQLLTFSRQHPMVPRVADLNGLISDTMKMLRRLVPSSIDLVTALDPALPRVKLDVSQFEQVLINLVVNARDALGGAGRIDIDTRRVRMNQERLSGYAEDPEGEHVLFRVRDDGCGIAPEDLPRIFEPFFTTKATGKGTGFGLAAVYGTVAQSGGWIDVESELGEGTSFSVFLPVALAEPQVQGVRPSRAQETTGGSESVLIVEDEHRVRRLLNRTLTRLGYRVMETGRPADAVAMSENYEGEIHLLLTDMVMPEMNGRELAARIREGRPDVRVLYMSGYPADDQEGAEPLDVDNNFIAKPMTLQNLGRMVRKVLESGDDAPS